MEMATGFLYFITDKPDKSLTVLAMKGRDDLTNIVQTENVLTPVPILHGTVTEH